MLSHNSSMGRLSSGKETAEAQDTAIKIMEENAHKAEQGRLEQQDRDKRFNQQLKILVDIAKVARWVSMNKYAPKYLKDEIDNLDDFLNEGKDNA